MKVYVRNALTVRHRIVVVFFFYFNNNNWHCFPCSVHNVNADNETWNTSSVIAFRNCLHEQPGEFSPFFARPQLCPFRSVDSTHWLHWTDWDHHIYITLAEFGVAARPFTWHAMVFVILNIICVSHWHGHWGTLILEQTSTSLADDIFKSIFLKENICYFFQLVPEVHSRAPTDGGYLENYYFFTFTFSRPEVRKLLLFYVFTFSRPEVRKLFRIYVFTFSRPEVGKLFHISMA